MVASQSVNRTLRALPYLSLALCAIGLAIVPLLSPVVGPILAGITGIVPGIVAVFLTVWQVRTRCKGYCLTDAACADLCRACVRGLTAAGCGLILLVCGLAPLFWVGRSGQPLTEWLHQLPFALAIGGVLATLAVCMCQRVFAGSVLLLNDGLSAAQREAKAKANRFVLTVASVCVLVTALAGVLINRFAFRPKGEVFETREALFAYLAQLEQTGQDHAVQRIDPENLTLYLREEADSLAAGRQASAESVALLICTEELYALWRRRKALAKLNLREHVPYSPSESEEE